jgi:hypothetical protein
LAFFLMIPTTDFFLFNIIYVQFDSIAALAINYMMFFLMSSILIVTGFMSTLFESEIRKIFPLLCSIACSENMSVEVMIKVKLMQIIYSLNLLILIYTFFISFPLLSNE